MENKTKQEVKEVILRELVRRGYSIEGNSRVWNLANPEMLYLTPEQVDLSEKVSNEILFKKDDEIEKKLFTNNFEDILSEIGNTPFNFIDLGVSGDKIYSILSKLSNKKLTFRYCPLDSSPFVLRKVFESFRKKFDDKSITIKAILGNLFSLEKAISELGVGRFKKNVFFMSRSTFTNFEPTEILYRIRRAMKEGDILILTSSIHHPSWTDRLKKYSSDKDLNNSLSSGLGIIGLDLKSVKPLFRFVNNRSEAVYTLKEDKTFKYNGRQIVLRKGDKIITLVSYKHKEDDLMAYLHMQFPSVDAHKSKDKKYLLAVCKT